MLAGELQRDKISANFLKVKGLQKIMLFWLPRLGNWCWKTFNCYYFFFVWKQVSYFLVSVLYILKTLVKNTFLEKREVNIMYLEALSVALEIHIQLWIILELKIASMKDSGLSLILIKSFNGQWKKKKKGYFSYIF